MKNKNNQFCSIIIGITPPQRQLIEAMNEFCREKFDFKGKTKEDAMEYSSKHINEFKLSTLDNWQIQYM